MNKYRLLFVCHGNICRSPMAEFVMKDLVNRAGVADRFEIASAATDTDEIWNGHGSPVYPPARDMLRQHGIGTPDNELGVGAKHARLLSRADYDRYDLLIGMDSENMSRMRRLFGGDPDDKVHLLMDYTDRPGEVSDPWYTRDFEATWRDVLEGCTGLLDALTE
ncbi:MAG: low molecular weight phosphotyrosine protein phosphatase [Lachnospiraceae bacterium]|nr:low molecular weight phosphotyrosine protein phosphatase [Lachnospiraceae bacterium]